MTNIEIASQVRTIATLPSLVDRAAKALQGARSSAEVLEARDLASAAYDVAKFVGRLSRARKAHDELIAAAHRAQADALEIEASAKRRLADEYDAAQARGEVVGRHGGGDTTVPARNAATAAEVGLSRKAIHEARTIRDAEAAAPGIVRKTLDDALAAGTEPTKSKVRKATTEAAKAKDAEDIASRDAARDAQSPEVKAAMAAKEERQLRGKKPVREDELVDRVVELENIVEDLTAENAKLKADAKKYDDMLMQYERGGFEEIIAGLKVQLAALEKTKALESQEKVRNLNSADYWRKIAIGLGFSRDTFIDIETGQEVPANG
jgi:hypothetical protein